MGVNEAVLHEAARVFAPLPASAGAARELVRALLVEGGRAEWVERAELAVSEVVTNAVLHAHTSVEVRAALTASVLRVEVRDSSPVMPVARQWGAEAATGRGMTLVSAMTSSHGVLPLQPHGKVVWFSIGGEEPPSVEAEALLDHWDTEEPDGHQVVLEAFPPALWLAAREHHDAILRDLALYRVGHAIESVTEEGQAHADLARLTVSASLDAALAELPEVPESLDLAVVVPADRRACFPVLQDVLDEAERLAAAEELLVRPGLPEIVALRDWVCEQVLAQTQGGPATPWAGAASAGFAEHAPPATRPLWDDADVAGSDRMLVAADDANRILAVSASLADVLGWHPRDLVGRRLVTIIPPHLREAHVAGFTRYLANGRRHVIGRWVELSALHADGRELPVRLFISESRAAGGRAVFVAELDVLVG